MPTILPLVSVASALRVSRRVAVIGGGSGGVVTARFLKKAGHDPVLFEAGATFGGVWADEPTNDVVYKHLQTNLPTAVMQSPDLDFAPGLPSYISKAQLGSYIAAYADTFGVGPMARFGAHVTRVAPVEEAGGAAAPSGGGAGERWRVEWTSGGAEQAETFDAVVVANGHYEEPYRPSLPGEAEWLQGDAARTIVHSRRYDDPAEFRGRSVLVVGGRSSGAHVCVRAWAWAWACALLRSGALRMSLRGCCVDAAHALPMHHAHAHALCTMPVPVQASTSPVRCGARLRTSTCSSRAARLPPPTRARL